MTDEEMIEGIATALEESFKNYVAADSRIPFEETGVSVPGERLWRRYGGVAFNAMHDFIERAPAFAQKLLDSHGSA